MNSGKAIIWCAVSSQAQANEDKVSLREQERIAREWCKNNRYRVIDVLKVEGYSRSESDIVTALETFRKQNVTAYDKLRDHWHDKDFDVLVAYNTSRLGRSNTLNAYVIENTIKNGMVIWLHEGGLINRNNYRSFIAIGGFVSTTAIDSLQASRHAAARKRIKKGLPGYHGNIIEPYRTVRDGNGNAIGIEPDDSTRPEYETVAKLLVDGLSWHNIMLEMHRRGFGHGDKPYASSKYYRPFYHPTFWGNTGINLDNYSVKWSTMKDACWNPNAPRPNHVYIEYGTHEPYLTGKLAEDVKKELTHRLKIPQGKRASFSSYLFSSALVCNQCGYRLRVSGGNYKVTRYGCNAHYMPAADDCDQHRLRAREDELQEWFDRYILQPLMSGSELEDLVTTTHDDSEIDRLNVNIEIVETQLTNLTKRLSMVGEAAATPIANRMNLLATQLHTLQKERDTLQRDMMRVTETQRQAVQKARDLKRFWQRPTRIVNRHILDILGDYKIVVQDGEAIGIAVVSR